MHQHRRLLIGLALFLTLYTFLPVLPGASWKNGSYADTTAAYDFSTDYGTHDWIAEAALKALDAADGHSFDWLIERKKIYLTGTEAPDNGEMSFVLDSVTVEGFGDTVAHHIYFNEDGTIWNNEDNAGIRAKSCGDMANANFAEGKLDLAAFYLGAMSHYIADMSVYCHVAPNNEAPNYIDFDADDRHSKFEGYVNTRSDKTGDMEEFFQIATFEIGNKKPYDAAKEVAWNTYKDSAASAGFNRGAVWMHNNFFSDWVSDSEDRAGDTSTHQSYYSRVEETLNAAIQATAAAINFEVGSDEEPEKNELIPGYPLVTTLFAISIGVIGLYLFIKKRSGQ